MRFLEHCPVDAVTPQIQAARDYFPRGLVQPPESFRFSIDALLLGAFCRLRLYKGRPAHAACVSEKSTEDMVDTSFIRVLELGTGCGVVALSMLLRFPRILATGVDRVPSLIQAAGQNAELLGVSGRFSTILGNITAPGFSEEIGKGCFDLVLANPPYRKRNQGKLPEGDMRKSALFEEESSLGDFCRAAASSLRVKGRFALIFPAPRLPELIITLEKCGFGIRRLLPVHSRKEDPALLVLLEAGKGMKSDLVLEPALVLYEDYGHNTRLTAEALAFCPALAANKKGSRDGGA